MALNKFEEYKNKTTSIKFFNKLFEARDFAHFAHLEAAKRSYAEHKALGDFYDAIFGLADDLYETYAGQYGLLTLERKLNISSSEPIEYFQLLGKELIELHAVFSEKDTHLHNILDEIVALVYHTLYKLKYLK